MNSTAINVRFPGPRQAMSRIPRFFALLCFANLAALAVGAQQSEMPRTPAVVQPGAPGQATRRLPESARASLAPLSRKDVDFMQGMIMHHAQAVEMVELIESRTQNRDIRLLGERISKSQEDEIAFMKRWLEIRGQSTSHQMSAPPDSHAHASHGAARPHDLMPGMLTLKQMDALKRASGAEFDRLFLEGMIQHHNGALTMVKELFESPGAGQDAELFGFATDVDSGQRAEIRSMENLLGKNHVKKKP